MPRPSRIELVILHLRRLAHPPRRPKVKDSSKLEHAPAGPKHVHGEPLLANHRPNVPAVLAIDARSTNVSRLHTGQMRHDNPHTHHRKTQSPSRTIKEAHASRGPFSLLNSHFSPPTSHLSLLNSYVLTIPHSHFRTFTSEMHNLHIPPLPLKILRHQPPVAAFRHRLAAQQHRRNLKTLTFDVFLPPVVPPRAPGISARTPPNPPCPSYKRPASPRSAPAAARARTRPRRSLRRK